MIEPDTPFSAGLGVAPVMKCDACNRGAGWGAAMPRKKGQTDARFILCNFHAANVRDDPACVIWPLPGRGDGDD